MNFEFFTAEVLTFPFLWDVFTDIQKEPRDFMFRGPAERKRHVSFLTLGIPTSYSIGTCRYLTV
jgi:hypothetical protein